MSSTVRHRLPHARSAALTLIALACTGPLLTGCGGERITDPSLTATARPTGFIVWRDPSAGVELSIPRDWSITLGKAPMVAVFSSGSAIISLFRYPDQGQAGVTGSAQLSGALTALEGAVNRQDPSVSIQAAGVSAVGGAGAVIIDAIERIDGKRRRVRSEHVYLDGAELVLETYAPVSAFPGLDHTVFSPVRKSLTLLHGGQPSRGQVSTSTTVTPTPATPTAPTATATPTGSTTGTGTGTGTGTAP